MRKTTNIKNTDGFTLVEIMIASAIMMILALLISTMLFNTNRQQTKLEKRASDADFVQSTALDLRLHPIPTST